MFRLCRRHARFYSLPPTHFSNPAKVPLEYGTESLPLTNTASQNRADQTLNSQNLGHEYEARSQSPLKELLTVLAMFTLAYLAVDNYTERIKLEKLNAETTAINVKTLQLQQQNYVTAHKQQEVKMLRERIETSKRSYKMALHVAMLRKQLADLGEEPVGINAVMLEFERNVKLNNSVQNLTGQAIWLDESSAYGGYVPDYREYDKRGRTDGL